ncbi:MAG: hypothetical protein AABZ60_17055 [Planctomycetota bacterium]
MKIIGTLKVFLNKTGTIQKDFWLDKLISFFQKTVEDEFYSLLHYLKQLYAWLQSHHITNLIQLSIDDRLSYTDEKNSPNDLEPAIQAVLDQNIEQGSQFTLLLEEDQKEFLVAIQLQFFDKHDWGKPALFLKYTGIPLQLLSQNEEAPEAYQKRIQSFLNSPERVAQEEAWKAKIQQRLTELTSNLADYLDIKKISPHVCIETQNDEIEYAFSYKLELWEKVHMLFHQIRFAEKPSEKKLPSWTQYTKQKVFNPQTGHLVQIRSLPPELQLSYRKAYTHAGGQLSETPFSQDLEAEGWKRLWNFFKKGWDEQIYLTIDEMKEEAPRTHAFLTNEDYRSAVLKESQKRIGTEIYDMADAMASAFVKEILEMRYIPKAWFHKDGPKTEQESQDHEKAIEQVLDIGEFIIGTLVPVAGFAVGGPVGGMMGIGLIWGLSQSLEFSEGRKITVAPSAFIERRKQIRDKRQEDRFKTKVRLLKLRGEKLEDQELQEYERLIRHDISQDEMIQIYADRFRNYGKKLISGESHLTIEQADLKKISPINVINALSQELQESQKLENVKRIPSQDSPKTPAFPLEPTWEQKIIQLELPLIPASEDQPPEKKSGRN